MKIKDVVVGVPIKMTYEMYITIQWRDNLCIFGTDREKNILCLRNFDLGGRMYDEFFFVGFIFTRG